MTFRWMSSNTRALAGRKIDRFNVSSARGSANFGGWTVGCSRLAHHSQHQHTPHKVSRPAFSTACASFRPGAVQCGLTSARGWNLEFQHCFSGTSSSTSRVVEDLNLGFNVHQARFSSDASAAAVGGGKVRGFSSSSDSSPTSPPTSPQNTGGKEKVVMETVEDAGMPRNEDDVSADATVPKEPRHSHILVPDITDEDFAALTSWSVNVGDSVEVGDVVCEIELEQFSVGVKVETSGYIAEILAEAGSQQIPVGASIATVVHAKEDIDVYLQAQEPQESQEAPELEAVEKEADEPSFSWKDVLRIVSKLAEGTKLSEDEASMLMSLSRHRDADLLLAFDACFEGTEYKGEIDEELFLVQARDIAKTRRKEQEKAAEAQEPGPEVTK